MNNYKKLALGLAAVASLIASTQGAYAATVQVEGSFHNPSASSFYFYNRTYNQDNDATPAQELPSNLNASTDSVAYFGWGVDVYESFVNQEIIQSHFWFNGTGSVDGSSATTITYGEAFSLGSFTYTNEQTVLSGGMVEIDFRMNIQLDGYGLMPIEYRIGIDNSTNPADDTASLLSFPESVAFEMNGMNYLLSMQGFSRDGGLSFETYADLPEGQQTSAEIYATITEVPVPAALWLFGTGLIALAGLARRKAA
ncbi:MAG TPA: choice-of-anchor K domain-containing protein [Gammaproteobacteria bacterium]